MYQAWINKHQENYVIKDIKEDETISVLRLGWVNTLSCWEKGGEEKEIVWHKQFSYLLFFVAVKYSFITWAMRNINFKHLKTECYGK